MLGVLTRLINLNLAEKYRDPAQSDVVRVQILWGRFLILQPHLLSKGVSIFPQNIKSLLQEDQSYKQQLKARSEFFTHQSQSCRKHQQFA
jgi:hypothetical protein